MQVAIPRDANEVQVHVRHVGDNLALKVLVDAAKLHGDHKSLRLIDCIYAVEGPGKVRLWWEEKGGKHALLLPLEGRGRLDCTPVGGILSPEGDFTGRVLISFNAGPAGTEGEPPNGAFFIGLEFAKVRA